MKKVSLLLFAALATLSMSAQDSDLQRANTNGNWFVGAGASASMYFGPNDQHASFLDRMTVNPTIMVGKWFNPYLGGRLEAQAGQIHTFTGNEAQNMFSMTHLNAHVDMMFNVTNLLAGYKEGRFYNFIPTVGIGYERRQNGGFFKGRGFNGPTFNASLLNTFRLTDKLSAFIEVGGYLVESRFDIAKGTAEEPVTNKTTNWNGIMNGTAGLIFNIGQQGFPKPAEQDLEEIARLNARINSLKSENDELRRRPVSCPPVADCPEVVKPSAPTTVVENFIPSVVFFKIGSAVIQPNQEIGIYNTAEYLKSNPNAKVKIIGYADKDTGTAAYNLKLSEKRAKNVADVLVSKYGISRNRITTEWKGSSEQPYKENAWNRVAIFFAD